MKTIPIFSFSIFLVVILSAHQNSVSFIGETTIEDDPVRLAYVTCNKEMVASAAQPDDDPILRMLEADANYEVTTMLVADDATVDLSGYDVVVVQEGFNSGAAILQPEGSLGLANIGVPFLYNKTYALRDGKALDSGGGTSSSLTGTSITVDPANQENELFKSITFTNNSFNVFYHTAADNGSDGTKALNYTYGLTISDGSTLLGKTAEILDPSTTVFVNDIPAGTTIGSETINARMILFGMNFGAICYNDGNNITPDGLTLWRNAINSLAGLTVPVVSTNPSCETNNAESITISSASIKGKVTSDGGSAITQRGFYWSSTNTSPGASDHVEIVSGTTGSYSYNLTGLSPSTTYYYCAFSTNSKGTSVGEVKQFTTLPEVTSIELPFYDDFSNNYQNWTAVSLTGSDAWDITDVDGIDGSKCARFNRKDLPNDNDDWLISNAINTEGHTNLAITFKYRYNKKGVAPDFYYAQTYNGNPETTTWIPIKKDFWISESDWHDARIEIENAPESFVFAIHYNTSPTDDYYFFLMDNFSIDSYIPPAPFELVGASDHFEFYTNIEEQKNYSEVLSISLENEFKKLVSVWDRPLSDNLVDDGKPIKVYLCPIKDIAAYSENTPEWKAGFFDSGNNSVYLSLLDTDIKLSFNGSIEKLAVNEYAQLALAKKLNLSYNDFNVKNFIEGFGLYETGYRPTKNNIVSCLNNLGRDPDLDDIRGIEKFEDALFRDLIVAHVESEILGRSYQGIYPYRDSFWKYHLKYFYDTDDSSRITLVKSTDHFDIYSIPDDKQHVDALTNRLEELFIRFTSEFELKIDNRFNILIYPNEQFGKELTERLESFYNGGVTYGGDNFNFLSPGNDQKLKDEMIGLISHEFWHVIHYHMRPNNGYPNGSFFMEGMADYMGADEYDPKSFMGFYQIKELFSKFADRFNREPSMTDIIENTYQNDPAIGFIDPYLFGSIFFDYLFKKEASFLQVKEFFCKGCDWTVFTHSYNEIGNGYIYYLRTLAGLNITIPEVETYLPTFITNVSATLKATNSFDGGSAITQRGFYWSSTNTLPGATDNIVTVAGTTGYYSYNLTGLSPSTTYYYRAFATNSEGTGLGEVKQFTTSVEDPNEDGRIKLAYVTSFKEMVASAAQPDDDPIIRMLEADANYEVTTMVVADDATVDLAGYDVVVVQEGFGSGATILQPEGSLGLANIGVPFLYNKTYALRDGKALDSGGGTSSSLTGTSITVDPADQENELFKSITFTNNSFNVFYNTAADNGGDGTKALNYTYGLTISDGSTLLGKTAEILDPSTTVFVNDIPAGTTIGSETINARIILFGMNFGAICYNDGNNITPDGLTLWHNAINSLAGLKVPAISTYSVSNITSTTAVSGGTITSDGGASITSKGVCWSTSQKPTISESKTNEGNGSSDFPSTLTGLQPNTKYYVRAYATNNIGTGYGNELSFTTSVQLTVPTCETQDPSNITSSTAQLNGTITANGGSSISQRGFYWSLTNTSPNSGDYIETVTGTTGMFSFSLTGLSPSTTYYYRAYAANSVGTALGEVKQFTTSMQLNVPTCETQNPGNITSSTAQLNGTITSDGGASITKRGFYWSSTNTTPGSGDHVETVSGTTGTFTFSLTSLIPSTTYYCRVYATNSVGTVLGEVKQFVTLAQLNVPTCETENPSNITSSTAQLNGTITSDGGASITKRGFYWSSNNTTPGATDHVETVSGTTGTYLFSLTGLPPSTTYYYRAYATNSIGTALGDALYFTTDPTEQLTELPFFDDFENDFDSWTTVNAKGFDWWYVEPGSFDGGKCARFSTNMVKPYEINDDWLVTPVFNSHGLSNIVITFNYYFEGDGIIPEFYYASSFDGDPLHSSWTKLDNSFWKNQRKWNDASLDIETPRDAFTFSIRYQSSEDKASYVWLDKFSIKANENSENKNIEDYSASENFIQIIPNPVTSKSIVRFSTETLGPVNLTVYTLRGEKICTLIDSELSGGIHNVSIGDKIKDTGFYLCTLITNQYIATIKLIKTTTK